VGTKMALHSPGFLHALVSRQLRLSTTCVLAFCGVLAGAHYAGLAAPGVGPAAGTLPAGPVTVIVLAACVAIAALYVRRAGDRDDEALGLVDVSTLPAHVRTPVLDESVHGD